MTAVIHTQYTYFYVHNKPNQPIPSLGIYISVVAIQTNTKSSLNTNMVIGLYITGWCNSA